MNQPDALELTPDQYLHLATARARRSLVEAPGLIAYVRTLITPGLGGASDGMPRPASRTAPLPLRADAVDDTDDVFARLLHWVSYWAGVYQTAPPSTMQVHWAQDGEITGFRASTTPEGAGALTQQATLWLLARHDLITTHDTGMTYFEDVADMMRDLRGRFPRAPRPPRGVLDRPCPVCDQYAFGATWTGNSVEQFELRCSKCEHTEDAASFIKAGRVRELLHELREEHAEPKSEWWSKRQSALELGITPQTLNRYIAEGLRTVTLAGGVYVKTDDLLDLWREKRLRMKTRGATRTA
ncbi:hypothetical protein [Frigoribacterium faeni]|uniref:Zn ribbon nucleic-acid-binding protein n=1 Tax=Frigoribacterium faeni TaxID=145483 RepID=A0A7W3PHU4_9MICO|nr:hypothetical protein [Frigoribacterium faeni]MBA8812685.1 Zn ribbon nucleic-acid-binding protein [Frigoribacterium faeni]BFF13797.1 hypothetical protein GCM10025699_51000 [Microbacterium flavescens]GEK82300.1 hypothetical protein FFA01_06090 [Frigoribacterium faeni]